MGGLINELWAYFHHNSTQSVLRGVSYISGITANIQWNQFNNKTTNLFYLKFPNIISILYSAIST